MFPRFRLVLPLSAALGLCACGADGSPPPASFDGPLIDANWSMNPSEYRGQDGLVVAFACPKDPVSMGAVWGTHVYTDDSAVCAAGAHAGVITPASGGTVVIEIRPGEDAYTGSTRHGVIAGEWGAWDGSFVVRH